MMLNLPMTFKMKSAITKLSIAFVLIVAAAGASVESNSECPRPDEISPCQCRTRGPSIQVRCTNSMIGRIMEAMQMIRRRVSNVDVLILENNNIPHLPARAFGSIRVNRVFIENNKMVTVDRNAFAGVEEYLSEIYIKEPLLKSLPTDAIDFLKELTVFSIENSQIMRVPRVIGMRKLKLFKIDGSQIKDLPARTLRDLPSLRYLHISRSPITRLDVGVLENLKYLALANFSDNQLNWIHPRAFTYLEELKEVSLRGNRISDASIPGKAMGAVKTLLKLDLSRNVIEELKQDSFVDVASLEELDLSHNRLTDLRRGSFHGLPRLKAVDLSHNRIRAFHSDAFVDTPLVEELRLNFNSLNQVSDLSFVMDTLPKLRFLDLNNNDVRDVPFGAFRGYPALERLYLSSNQISRVSSEAFAEMPSLAELDLSRNKLIADAVDGPIFNLPQLKILNLSFNKLSKLNNKLLTSLGSLRRLDVSHNGITEMEEDVLQSVKHLDYLNISFNNLHDLHPKIFSGLTKLFELDASNNELSALPEKLLDDQRELEYVSFTNNQIQEVSGSLFSRSNRVRHLDLSNNYILDFPNKLMEKCTNLEKLIFRRNSILSLDRQSFRGLHNLEVIDFHDNRIENIEENAFEDLTSLKGLDLSLNVISTVGDSLEPLTSLMKLNLSDNYLTSLPRNAFHALRHLSTLDVSNNTIVEIGTAFTDMPELKYLDLSYNHQPVVKKGAFRNLPSLVGLRLDHNSIIDMEEEAFQDLLNLETLILSKNGIATLRRDTFRNLPSLEKLKIDDNLIEKLEDRAFTDLFSLKELHLEHNLIEDIYSRSFERIPSLRFLNLSYNLLRDLPRSGFYGLDTLETLDLSFNDIRSIDDKTFESMRWITVLKLNDNNICHIEKSAFEDASSLQSLSLSNNRITRLHQSNFDGILDHISKLEIEGNPLSCDCNALWLRNWASDEDSPIEDEPRCSYPKSLSGSSLRMLRTSRFTCDMSRSSEVITNACMGIPLKTPARKEVKAGLISAGVFDNLESATTTMSSTVNKPQKTVNGVSKPLRRPASTPVEVSNPEDDIENPDVEDEESGHVTSKPSKMPDNYEYYYVYYDEEGNVVDKSANVGATTIPIENKLQELNLNPDGLAEILPEINSGNTDSLTGDTPTIYAGLNKKNATTEDEKKEEGMSIFGIPIPQIPFPILSFGLAPALSHGLLPIGRKGETDNVGSNAATLVKELAESAVSRRQLADLTRGPDQTDPVYVDDSNIAPNVEVDEEEVDDDQPLFNDNADSGAEVYRPKRFGYMKPENPIIPLQSSYNDEDEADLKYFPTGAASEDGEYYPKNFLPAIKFDHPLPPGGLESQRRSPVRPMPSLEQSSEQPPVEVDRINVDYTEYQKTVNSIHRHTEDGFLPLFQPNNADPMYNRKNNQPPPAIQFTDEEPFQTVPQPTRLQPTQVFLSKQKKRQQLPEDVKDKGEANRVNPVVEIIPVDPRKRPTKVPPIQVTRFPLTPPPKTEEIVAVTTQDPPKIEEVTPDIKGENQDEVEEEEEYEYIDDDSEGEESLTTPTATSTTTSKPVLTLVDKEEFGVSAESQPTTVEIVHKGTPPEVASTSESSVKNSTYEYEYYYEDEDSEDVTEVDESSLQTTTFKQLDSTPTSTTQKVESSTTTEANGGSFLSTILGFVSGKTVPPKTVDSPEEPALTRPPVSRPTPASPIRTSTMGYELDGNYLQNKRSSVTVDSVEFEPSNQRLESKSDTSPYPFHPDRIDPAAHQPDQDNNLKWYYSKYNNEESDPFIDTTTKRLSVKSDSRCRVPLTDTLYALVFVLNLFNFQLFFLN